MEDIGSKEYVIPILRNAERLRRLTEDILQLAKIESQTLKLNKEHFYLGKTVMSVAQDLINQNGRHNGKKSKVHFFSDNIEERPDEDIIVEADKARIIQVISNILSNAIQFTKKGDVNISLIRMSEIIESNNGKYNNNNDNNNKGEVIVSVKDTGIGIDPHVFPRLFSKFAIMSDAGGIGLGLLISKNIIDAHGGRIWAENNANGNGATFSFSLPINN